MARPLRIQFPGAVYPVIARGSHAEPIFGDDADRRASLQALGEACAKTGWRIHAYLLMKGSASPPFCPDDSVPPSCIPARIANVAPPVS